MANRVAERMGPIGSTKHRVEVLKADRRWLLAWAAVFVGTLLALFAAHQLYRLTGPHPQVTALVRQLKHEARWLIPGLKRKPNASGADILLLPIPHPGISGASDRNGHAAHLA
jgi:hypothetical protein